MTELKKGTRIQTLVPTSAANDNGFCTAPAGTLGTVFEDESDAIYAWLDGYKFVYSFLREQVNVIAGAPPTLEQQLEALRTENARLRDALVEIAAAGPVMVPRMSQYVNRDACMIATGKWELSGMARKALEAIEDKAVNNG